MSVIVPSTGKMKCATFPFIAREYLPNYSQMRPIDARYCKILPLIKKIILEHRNKEIEFYKKGDKK